MSRERELLERAYHVLGELSYAMLKDSGEYNLAGDIYEYLASEKQDQPEPVAYWDTLNNILVPAVPLVSKRTCFKVEAVPLYLHPAPQRSFVRLSEEEMQKIVRKTGICWNVANKIQDALDELNNER